MNSNAEVFSIQAHAKVNLFLDILGRREDGYHSIQSIMQTIDLADTIRVAPRADDQFILTCSDPSLPQGPQNLAVKAALALRDATSRWFGFDIHLDKRIPAGAGLGGGSADAAAVMKLIRQAARLQISDADLAVVAARVGSDAPFFVSGGTALACGRGEILSTVENNCAEGGIVVVCPDAHVSTPEAYRWWDESGMPRTRVRVEQMIEALHAGDWRRVADCAENAFQEIVESRVPTIAAARRELAEAGCMKAVLSGSGAAVFGLTETEPAARRMAERLKNHYPLVIASPAAPKATWSAAE
ncbi:MAG: 4-(cytidine 5'-diphospho)-2-C-methyl-D-erythritol kinase [Candidatus Sumerlaeota bacterium]|nr:4-(cytidine 5'-diphospho)-2-C-methyl-D-erythritol kinase [Candidatus Sumerlaeota bacterium]